MKSAPERAGTVAETSQPPGGPPLNEGDLRQLADLCCESAQRFFGVALDFSPQSLALADRIISQALEGPEPTLGAVLPWGAYLGEVVVRHLGGRWEPRPAMLETAVVVGDRALLPFQRAAQRLRHGADFALEAWFNDLAGEADA